jgi:Fe2+ transport system protein FeoA
MLGGCRKVRCANCGYELPQEPRWLTALVGRLRGRGGGRGHGRGHRHGHGHQCPPGQRRLVPHATPLTAGAVGDRGVVAHLLAGDDGELHKLMAMGVLPGARVQVMRRRPCCVFRVHFSEYAIDDELAARVLVHWSS